MMPQNCTNELPPCTREPEAELGNEPRNPAPANDDAPALPATVVPRPASRNEPEPDRMQPAIGTPEPERRLNRHRRRVLAATERKRAA
jgi:hypothetical protein